MMHIIDCLNVDIENKGDGAFVSDHEAYGVIAEENDELLEALRSNEYGKFESELIDVIVSCLWALASRQTNALEENKPVNEGEQDDNLFV